MNIDTADLSTSSSLSSSGDPPPPQPVRTFETTSENIDVRLHNGQSKPESETEKSRREFMRLLRDDTVRNASRQKTVRRREPQQPPPRLSHADVMAAADQLLRGKKVDVSDVYAVSDILLELDERRLSWLQKDEYVKSKRIADVMDDFKRQFYTAGQEHMYSENRKHLEQKLKDGKEALESTTKEWKQKKKEFVRDCQKTLDHVHEEQDEEHVQLEAKWTAPSTKRRFSKRSPELLQQQAIERYLVFAGRLDEAEKLKARNQQTERREAQVKFKEMSTSFEGARSRLLTNQGERLDNVRTDQDFKMRDLTRIEQSELGVRHKRVSAVEHDINEVNTVDKYMLKKFRRQVGSSLPVACFTSGENIAPFTRGRGFNRSETHPNVLPVKSGPLQLPEFTVKPMKTKPLSVSFKA